MCSIMTQFIKKKGRGWQGQFELVTTFSHKTYKADGSY